MITQIILILLALVAITVIYRLLPHRSLGKSKPSFALMPKYKQVVDTEKTNSEIEQIMSGLGFKKVKEGAPLKYTRGSVLGDISIKLSKVDVHLSEISPKKREISIQAGWIAGFDTGDHWQFLYELSKKIEDA